MQTTFNMASDYITMMRGDTLAFGLYIAGLGEQDLETAFFTCKANKSNEILFQKSLGTGISKLENEKYAIRVAPEDTKNLEAGKYYYDFQIGLNSDVFTVLHGVLEIDDDITTN